jgi:hypothetical protein
MKTLSLLILVAASLLSSCNQNKNQVPVVGDLDSAAIARDTAMQMGFESSYEYHKTLVANQQLVYDVVGYGGSASNGEFAILRRAANNKADTVVKQPRRGVIADAYLGGDNASREEIYVVIRNPADSADKKTLKFELDKERLTNHK